MVRAGTVVVDVAHPLNVPPAEYPRFRARGCDVVPGGLVRIPRYSCGHEFYLPDPRDTFACLAETYLFAREGIREHSVGQPTEATAARLERAARRHGVRPRELAGELGASVRARARTSVRFGKACGAPPVGASAPRPSVRGGYDKERSV
jgi:hypothetical protein